MKKIRLVLWLLALLIIGPMWYYLMYKILQMINATELMWFVYWVYAPLAFVLGGIKSVLDDPS